MSLDMFAPQGVELTVLSMGLGQDSTALLYKYAFDQNFREQYAPNNFLVVYSDTGNEFPETYRHLEEVKAFCKQQGIEFVALTPDMGYHSGDWQSLPHFYEVKDAVGSKAYPKICSQRLKIDPIYRFLEDYLVDRYKVKGGNKKGIRQFALEYGKIRMMIGIAKNEEGRMSDASQRKERWYRDSIEHSYPLVTLQMDREACQAYIKSVGKAVPIPSNCMMCPFLSLEELEYLRRFHPDQLRQWVYFEDKKLNKWKHLDAVPVKTKSGKVKIENKNLGVWGKKRLPEVIKLAKEKFSEWTDERIIDYRMSHGHCVKTGY